MGGVGSFERNNKTLYIGGLKINPGTNTEEIIRRHFGAFGEIDLLNIIPSKSIAFVRYKLRLCAEFAKEAMADQNLDGEEVINVRWANSDPNPVAQERDKIDQLVEAADAVQTKFPDLWAQEVAMLTGQYPQTDSNYQMYQQYFAMNPAAYYQYYYGQTAEAQSETASAESTPTTAAGSETQKKRKRDESHPSLDDTLPSDSAPKKIKSEDDNNGGESDASEQATPTPDPSQYAGYPGYYYPYYGYYQYPGYQYPAAEHSDESAVPPSEKAD